jgi:8-oxo-dGTP diphosphatase
MTELLLLFIALILLFLLLPIVVIYMLLKYLFTGKKRIITVWACKTARSIDVFANVEASELFNDILIKKGGYKFGNRQETISSVLGKNQVTNTLTRTGNGLRIILDCIEQDHCLISINEDLTNTTK